MHAKLHNFYKQFLLLFRLVCIVPGGDIVKLFQMYTVRNCVIYSCHAFYLGGRGGGGGGILLTKLSFFRL